MNFISGISKDKALAMIPGSGNLDWASVDCAKRPPLQVKTLEVEGEVE
jgi:hypothetical protein